VAKVGVEGSAYSPTTGVLAWQPKGHYASLRSFDPRTRAEPPGKDKAVHMGVLDGFGGQVVQQLEPWHVWNHGHMGDRQRFCEFRGAGRSC
jgi:hypothetical protein